MTADEHAAAAYALDREGREAEAVVHYDAAAALGGPSEDRAGFSLGHGSTLRNVGRLDDSLAVLHKAVAEFPGDQAIRVFLALALLMMFCFGMMFANFTAMAMEPQGAIAGTASSLYGSITTLVGIGIGAVIGQSYDGTLKPFAGRIERNGFTGRDIAYLPQAAEIDRSFPINVYDMVAMGLWRRIGPFGAIGRAEQTTIETAIARVGLAGFELRAIGTLSGGQMQRMLFARLLVQDAQVIVLDEPFSGLDPVNAELLRAAVLDLRKEGSTVIFSTHDMSVAEKMCDFIFMIYKGKKVLDGTLESIQDAYG